MLRVIERGLSATKKYISRKLKSKRVTQSVDNKSGRGALGARERAYGKHWRKS